MSANQINHIKRNHSGSTKEHNKKSRNGITFINEGKILNQSSTFMFLKVSFTTLVALISMVRAGILPTNQRTLYEIFGSGIDTDDNLRTKGFDEVSRAALSLK